MGFRTLEISHAAEIHIKEGQLEIATDDGVAVVPIEDLNQIMVHGANIRLSTMDLSILSQNKVALMTLDDRYLPTAIVLPFEGHARQSKLMHAQVNTAHEKYMEIWIDIIKQKISNQSRALSIMGLDGAEKIAEYVAMVDEENVDYCESKYKRTIRIHNFILFLIKWTKILWTEYCHCSSGVSNPDAEIVFSSDCIKICSRG